MSDQTRGVEPGFPPGGGGKLTGAQGTGAQTPQNPKSHRISSTIFGGDPNKFKKMEKMLELRSKQSMGPC